ncbi:hypothetical protein [Sporofaciens musculi]|nr:hypothetical protein [Sporofaciens musculi]
MDYDDYRMVYGDVLGEKKRWIPCMKNSISGSRWTLKGIPSLSVM